MKFNLDTVNFFKARIDKIWREAWSLYHTFYSDNSFYHIDAFQHAYGSGVLALQYSSQLSYLAGVIHEIDMLNRFPETNMDLWNNKVGLDISKGCANKIELAKAVKNALDRGDLIIDPLGDPRRANASFWHDPLVWLTVGLSCRKHRKALLLEAQ